MTPNIGRAGTRGTPTAAQAHPGSKLSARLRGGPLVEVVAVFDALSALLAEQAGFDAVVVGGGAIANFSHALPDVGLLSPNEIVAGVSRICETVTIPVIVDIDDGGVTPAHVWRSVRLAEQAGAAAVMIEDVDSGYAKHLWDEQLGNWDFAANVLRPAEEAVERVSTALAARVHPDFLIMARTDAFHAPDSSADQLAEARRRAALYAGAGADLLFLVGLPVEQIAEAANGLGAPVMVSSPRPLTDAEKDPIRDSGAFLFYGSSVPIEAFVAVRDCLSDLRSGTIRVGGPDHPAERIRILEALGLPEWSELARGNRTRPDSGSARP